MDKKMVFLDYDSIPAVFHNFLDGCTVFDSSCSNDAQVWFLDKGHGFYLKKAVKNTLQKESAMYEFYHKLGFAPKVLAYESLDWDWLLTCKAAGEDCLAPKYLQDPQRLCDTTAQLLRMLHETNPVDCPVVDRTKDYLSAAQMNYHLQNYDTSLFPDNWGYASAEDAWREIETNKKYLRTDILLHGDYCLPNIMLNNWQFSAFIDLGAAGVGDRHIDLFWGIWSLQYNLKTNRYAERFLDAYGRDQVNQDIFPTIAAIEVFS